MMGRANLNDDVLLVNMSRHNIKRLVVRNRLCDRSCVTETRNLPMEGVGTVRGTVWFYQTQCLTSGELCMAETGKALSVRFRERLAGARKRSFVTPLGERQEEVHRRDVFNIKCTVLLRKCEIGPRTTSWTHHERNPK